MTFVCGCVCMCSGDSEDRLQFAHKQQQRRCNKMRECVHLCRSMHNLYPKSLIRKRISDVLLLLLLLLKCV